MDKLDRRTSIEAIEKPFGFITMAIWFFGFVGVVASIGLWVLDALFLNASYPSDLSKSSVG